MNNFQTNSTEENVTQNPPHRTMFSHHMTPLSTLTEKGIIFIISYLFPRTLKKKKISINHESFLNNFIYILNTIYF